MAVPKFSISANGVDITDRIAGAGISMTITDDVGLNSDTLQIVIDDVEGSVEEVKTGAILNPVGGYEGRMRDFGLFSVDTVTYSGWPQIVSIQAKSVAAKSLAKQRDPKAYPKKDYPTYGDIFAEVAGRINLKLSISATIKSAENEYEAQTEENGLEFLTRIGEKLNASITVKANHLVVVESGEGGSSSGVLLDVVRVAAGYNLLSYSVTEKDEPKHSSVEASYYDRNTNKKEVVTEPTELDGPKFCLTRPYQNEKDAKKAAKSQSKKLSRDTREASFEIDGEPFAQAEAMADVSGCRSRVDGIWSIKSVAHNFSSSGPYTTSLSCTEPSSKETKGKFNSSKGASGKSKPKANVKEPGEISRAESGAPLLTGDPNSNIG